MGIYIPKMDKPKNCRACNFKSNKEGECWFVHDENDCPLIEIIPCKECKNSHMTYDGKCKYCDLEKDDDDNFIECYFDGDHFCSDGERRSE